MSSIISVPLTHHKYVDNIFDSLNPTISERNRKIIERTVCAFLRFLAALAIGAIAGSVGFFTHGVVGIVKVLSGRTEEGKQHLLHALNDGGVFILTALLVIPIYVMLFPDKGQRADHRVAADRSEKGQGP